MPKDAETAQAEEVMQAATPRQAAMADGLTQYFTGKPCKHGHVAKRNTIKGDCVACHKVVHDRWLAENPGKNTLYTKRWISKQDGYHRTWYAANSDKRRQAASEYKKANRHLGRVQEHNRRARVNNAEGFHTADDIAEITARQKGRCACCKKRRKLTVDHIIALINGGSNWPRNIQMLCKSCNSKKSRRDPVEFMQSMGALL
jgi:5-methylcytosine-specific restriction endonuclease McrA